MEFFDLSFVMLILSTLCSLFLLCYVLKKKTNTQLKGFFVFLIMCVFIMCVGLIDQKFCVDYLNTSPIYFENFIYIGTCFLPVAFLLMSLSFVNTRIKFKASYLLLFVIPIISLLLLWTNNYHHLFYESYPVNNPNWFYISEWSYGPYFYVHTLYTYILFIVGLFLLIKHSIKNSGFFSRQSILIICAILVPLVSNIIATFGIISATIYVTPVSFVFSIFCLSLAIFHYNFLSVTPIALEKIVDRMSDSFVVLDANNMITDFNESFLATFNLEDGDVRNTSIFDWDKAVHLDKLAKSLQAVTLSPKTVSFDTYIKSIDKYFSIEISSIVNKNLFLGTLILFKDTTQHMKDLDVIQSKQDMLIEKERFASLGQMIGGIAHNLKTPIMSISGATEALNDLVTEYTASVGDPDVTVQDHHDIARDMSSWIAKIQSYTSYMSDIITAVKGQAVETTDNISAEFTIEELVKRVNILMKHELKHSLVELNAEINVENDFILHGDINCLVQVINNLISNAIQSYGGKPDNKIDFIIDKSSDAIVFSVRDYGCGMTKDVQKKLFKEMITTKGKNGTGLRFVYVLF